MALTAISLIEGFERNRDVTTVSGADIAFRYNWWDNQSMTTRQVLIVGGIVGLLVSSVVLALIWFGVGGILNVGGTDLMYVFWPSSVMLVVGWRSTIPGVMITASSVVINCLLYMAVGYLLLLVARFLRGFLPRVNE